VLIFASVFISLTGVVLWWPEFFGGPTSGLFQWSLVLHSGLMILIGVIMLAHIYLGAGIFQPYKGSGKLMFGNGRVTESDALYHWGHWAKDELKKGNNVIVE